MESEARLQSYLGARLAFRQDKGREFMFHYRLGPPATAGGTGKSFANQHRSMVSALLLLLTLSLGSLSAATQQPPRSPSDTVRDFYKAMREKRFADAFGMSIYKTAIEGLKPQELEDLRTDFDRMADIIPEKVEITGEQISGNDATVFVKVPKDNDPSHAETEPVSLIGDSGKWIIGDRENQEIVKKAGNRFFFQARIEAHHNEVKAVLGKISIAQLAYFQLHNGVYADLATLITAGLLDKDLAGTESTGYRFHIELAKDAKTFTAGAEPAQYGRTGVLSFFMDQSGVRSGDLGGKPLNPSPE
jgi:hypothetical protein